MFGGAIDTITKAFARRQNQMTIQKIFNPSPDITAYELAQLMSKIRPFFGPEVIFGVDQWSALDKSLRRHFRDKDA